MNRFILLSAAGIISAVSVGCNSFNHYQIPDEPYRHLVDKGIGNSIPKELRDTSSEKEVGPVQQLPPLCPLYHPPAIQKVPELPYRELAATSPEDKVALDRIQQKHIDDLRLYISQLSAAIRAANKQYLRDCGLDVSSK